MDSLVFMDGMDFWNDSVGLVYGDPLSGYHFILKTTDSGESWSRIPQENIPENLEFISKTVNDPMMVCLRVHVG